MSEIQDAYQAFEAAQAAGDSVAAGHIASAIHTLQSKSREDKPLEDPIASAVGLPGTSQGEPGARNMFSMGDKKQTSAGQVAGAVGGGSLAGGVAGAALPSLLKAGSKLPLPAPIRGLMYGAGTALGDIPMKERVAKGMGGGAVMGGTEEMGEALGLPRAVTGAAALAGGIGGEAAGSLVMKEGKQLLTAAANLAHGNMSGVFYALKGTLSPNKEMNTVAAKKLQEKLLGPKLPNYTEQLQETPNQLALQSELRKVDPSLVTPRNMASKPQPNTSSTSRELAPLGGEVGFSGQQRASSGATGSMDAAGRIKARQTESANRDPVAEQNMKPASQIYRERLFTGVTKAVEQGNTFSATPQYQGFKNTVGNLIERGKIPASEGRELLRKLELDRSPNSRTRQSYAKDVDDQIRQWGKPQESGGQTGAAAIPANMAKEVRQTLRDAYNGYTEKIGLGQLEKQYRDTFGKEMIAEAKDKLPQVMSGIGAPDKLADLARNLAKDPQGKEFIQSALAKHLAQQEPKEIVREFEKTQKALLESNMIRVSDLFQMRAATKSIQDTSEKGAKLKAQERMKQIVMMSIAQTMGAAGGSQMADRRN